MLLSLPPPPPFQDVQVISVIQTLAGKSFKLHQTFQFLEVIWEEKKPPNLVLCPLLSKHRDCLLFGPPFKCWVLKEKIHRFFFWNEMWGGSCVCVWNLYTCFWKGLFLALLLTSGYTVLSVSICYLAWCGAGVRPVGGVLAELLHTRILLRVTLLATKLSWILIWIYKCERLMAWHSLKHIEQCIGCQFCGLGFFCIKISQYF